MSNLELVYQNLTKVEYLDVFKKKDIPEKLHYQNNVRTGDLLLIARIGYVIFVDNNKKINWTRIRKIIF